MQCDGVELLLVSCLHPQKKSKKDGSKKREKGSKSAAVAAGQQQQQPNGNQQQRQLAAPAAGDDAAASSKKKKGEWLWALLLGMDLLHCFAWFWLCQASHAWAISFPTQLQDYTLLAFEKSAPALLLFVLQMRSRSLARRCLRSRLYQSNFQTQLTLCLYCCCFVLQIRSRSLARPCLSSTASQASPSHPRWRRWLPGWTVWSRMQAKTCPWSSQV